MSAHSSKPLIAIGICTRQRNALLRRLLESISKQPVPPNYNVEIIVVDNNDVPAVTPDIVDLPSKFKLTLIHEAEPGMVTARNRVLDAAMSANADWFVGVDDDEWVAADWLAQFILGFKTLDAAIIVAARRIVYPKTTSPFVEQFQQLQEPAGALSEVFSTANFAIHKSVLHPEHGPGLRFEPTLNEAGSVDFEFMLRAKRQYGISAVNWPHAVTTEEFDGKRATFAYHFKRRMRDQVVRYRIAALHRKTGLHGSYIGNARRLFVQTNRYFVFGMAQCLGGAVFFMMGRPMARQQIGNGVLRLGRAFAIFPYLVGKYPVNYGAGVNADRTDRKN